MSRDIIFMSKNFTHKSLLKVTGENSAARCAAFSRILGKLSSEVTYQFKKWWLLSLGLDNGCVFSRLSTKAINTNKIMAKQCAGGCEIHCNIVLVWHLPTREMLSSSTPLMTVWFREFNISFTGLQNVSSTPLSSVCTTYHNQVKSYNRVSRLLHGTPLPRPLFTNSGPRRHRHRTTDLRQSQPRPAPHTPPHGLVTSLLRRRSKCQCQ